MQAEATAAWVEAGPLRVALPDGPATLAGRELKLTDMERGVLRLLLLHQGRAVGRETILARLYPAVAPEARVVDVFVCRLRRKLAREGLRGIIGTVWRQGYVLQPPRAARRGASRQAGRVGRPVAEQRPG